MDGYSTKYILILVTIEKQRHQYYTVPLQGFGSAQELAQTVQTAE
jgi:hypothetical protein